MARKRNRPVAVVARVGDSAPPDQAAWRRAWIEGSKDWSAEAQAIAATAPLEEVAPLIFELARAGRLSAPRDDDDLVDRMFARARELDPEAWQHHAQLQNELGRNPDELGVRPRNEIEQMMRDRRSHSMSLASDALLCEGRPDIAEALRSLERLTAH